MFGSPVREELQWKVHAAQQILEARVVAQAAHTAALFPRKSVQHRKGLGIGNLQPPETNLCADPCRRSFMLAGEKHSNMLVQR